MLNDQNMLMIMNIEHVKSWFDLCSSKYVFKDSNIKMIKNSNEQCRSLVLATPSISLVIDYVC